MCTCRVADSKMVGFVAAAPVAVDQLKDFNTSTIKASHLFQPTAFVFSIHITSVMKGVSCVIFSICFQLSSFICPLYRPSDPIDWICCACFRMFTFSYIFNSRPHLLSRLLLRSYFFFYFVKLFFALPFCRFFDILREIFLTSLG